MAAVTPPRLPVSGRAVAVPETLQAKLPAAGHHHRDGRAITEVTVHSADLGFSSGTRRSWIFMVFTRYTAAVDLVHIP
jgi:hypothetical protein